MDYFTSVKRRACEVGSVVDTKLFFGHGLTNMMMMMFALQCKSFRIGETLRYYWSQKPFFLERLNHLTTCKSRRRCNAMQAKLQEQLSPVDAEVILGRLPGRIRASLIARATEIEYPIEAVVEMAIASFLDTEALGFADCKPGRGQ
jgi:hypothetical protein